MRYTDNDHPFTTDNRAWRRFIEVASEHFELGIECVVAAVHLLITPDPAGRGPR